jgi:hypothetical protein
MSLSKFHQQLILNRIFLLEKKGKLNIKKGFYSNTFSLIVPKDENSTIPHKILFIIKKNEFGEIQLITKKPRLDLSSFSDKEKAILLKGKVLHTPKNLFCIHKPMNTFFSISKELLKDFLKNDKLQFKNNTKLKYSYNKVLSSAQIEEIAMGKNVTLEVNVYNSKSILQGIITKTITADPSFFRGKNSFNLKTLYLKEQQLQHKRNESV